MRVTVEILSNRKLVHTIIVEAQSLEAAKATAQSMMDAAKLSRKSYRLLNRYGQEPIQH